MWASSDKAVRAYLLIALFLGAFALVYERFSHGAWSACMVFAWMLPLGLGALPRLILPRPPVCAAMLWHCGVAALTAGSLLQGVLEIYGTTHTLMVIYPILGTALCCGGAAGSVWGRKAS